MNAKKLLEKYYTDHQEAFDILLPHSIAVQEKAIDIAEHSGKPDLDISFIKEASLLHDIGVFRTFAPPIGCHGSEHYLKHGIIGREILEHEGYRRHALVCERHIGVGLTREDIIKGRLPLPARDMVPLSDEEKIICISDLFFNKSEPDQQRSLDTVRKKLVKFGKTYLFETWIQDFNVS
ncbi:MAG: HD domain-containing protein [candidate division KSB1 bacterium]|nr:HD domain-containing protein [candidate division KSB1 bacterium]